MTLLTGLDHVALVVEDLDAAAARCEVLLGVAPNWRGADGGAAHVWFQLSNMALDVIAPTGPGYTGDRVKARLEQSGEGIWAIAFATPDMDKTQRTLARRGLSPSPPRPIRSTSVETGEKRYWTTSVLDGNGAPIFLVEQKPDAPAWPRSPETADHAVSGLDHVVIQTPDPERAAAFYGARLGLDMRLDRANPDWGTRLIFFRCGDLIVEIAHALKAGVSDGPDKLWGLSWRVADPPAARARLAAAGFDVSEVRAGRKPGTAVFTIRDRTCGVPTLAIGAASS